MNEFIAPNWHAFLIHAPLGLLGVGVVIELLSFLWPRAGLRTAGRWMICLGALLAVPTMTAGIYALRGAVTVGPNGPGAKWDDIVQNNHWSAAQWETMTDHLLLAAVAAAVFIAVVVTGIALSDKWRKKLHWPLWLATLAGMFILGLAAWHGGEAVYRYGTAVNPGAMGGVSLPAADADLEYYIPPLELHMVLAGLVVAMALGALGVSLRKWHNRNGASKPLPLAGEGDKPADRPTEPQAQPATIEGEQPKLFPGWLWLTAFFLGLATVTAGAWSVMDGFSLKELKINWILLHMPKNLRLVVHVISGATILVAVMVLAILVRFASRRHALTVIMAIVLGLAVTVQVYGGTLMVFDSWGGPLLGFDPAPIKPVIGIPRATTAPATQASAGKAASAPASAPSVPPTTSPATLPASSPASQP